MDIEVKPYESSQFDNWNTFIAKADNSHFLFNRNFMDYHSDRFHDNSLLLYEDAVLVGVFPANKKEQTIYSHQGLTFGGLILNDRRNEKKLIRYFYSLFHYLYTNGFTELIYKPIPNYISKTVNEFEHFVLNMTDAKVDKVDTSFVIDNTKEFTFQERRKRSIKKGAKQQVDVRFDNNFEAFWNDILVPNLQERFAAKPVHSLDEIKLLHSRFPEKIKQVNGYINNEINSGVTLFEFENTVHCQYISSNVFGKDSGAIDFLFNNLIHLYQNKALYFSLGTANNSGKDLNFGLCDWKEGWGARIWAHFHYRISLVNFKHLEKFTTI